MISWFLFHPNRWISTSVTLNTFIKQPSQMPLCGRANKLTCAQRVLQLIPKNISDRSFVWICMKIYIAAYQSKAYDIQNTNIMVKKLVIGSVSNWKIIWYFLEQSTLIVKMTPPCAAGINYYSQVPPKAYELALFYLKSKCQRKKPPKLWFK